MSMKNPNHCILQLGPNIFRNFRVGWNYFNKITFFTDAPDLLLGIYVHVLSRSFVTVFTKCHLQIFRIFRKPAQWPLLSMDNLIYPLCSIIMNYAIIGEYCGGLGWFLRNYRFHGYSGTSRSQCSDHLRPWTVHIIWYVLWIL